MQLDQTTVSLQPRRAFGCIDVAVRFYGRHLLRILEIWALVALPCCVLTYILTVRSEMDVRLTFIVLYVGTWVAGVLTVSGASRALFGEPFVPIPERAATLDFPRLLQMVTDLAAGVVGFVIVADIVADILGTDFVYGAIENTWYAALFALLIVRLVVAVIIRARVTPGFWPALWLSGLRRGVMIAGPLLVLFPMGVLPVLIGVLLSLFSLVLALRTGFVAESKMLASLDEQLRGQGLRALVKKEGGDLFVRSWLILGFCSLLAIVVFFTIDRACQDILGYPILIGRIGQVVPLEKLNGGPRGADFFATLGALIASSARMLLQDSRCLTVFAAAVMLVYPIVRLAWFFCYIDLRVRRDCWDMELLFRQEARRLEGLT
jgi:hypothetical protein